MVWYGMVIGGLVIMSFTGFTSKTLAGDATLTLDDNAGSSSFVVQDVDKVNQFKINSDGQGYFAGNVGIGTTNPVSSLVIEKSESTWTPQMRIYNPHDGWISMFAFDQDSSFGNKKSFSIGYISGDEDLENRLLFRNNSGSEVVTIKNTGNVGIGTTSPSEKLEVSGNIKASGTVSQGSSKEFKKNISYVSTKDAMNVFNKLNPVRFEYKTDNSGEKHLGFIAEDVPDLVAEGDRKHLNAMDITAVLTKVVQEQQKMLQEQQETISVLKVELEEVKGKIQ